MEDVPNPKLVDGRGDPVAPRIEVALTRLLPQFQQRYPALRDELVRAEVLEEAARRIAERERRSGPVDKIYAYAWTALRNAVEMVEVQRKSLAAAEERAKISRAQYSIGLLSFDNWTIIEDGLVQAKNRHLDACWAEGRAEAAWVQALGGTLEDEL